MNQAHNQGPSSQRLTVERMRRRPRFRVRNARFGILEISRDTMRGTEFASYYFMDRTIKSRFFAKVNKTETCWLWIGSMASDYGQIRYLGKLTMAHRVSWIIHQGNIPDNLLVLHTCDQPSCVNPKHLWLGTHKDNTQDMLKKNRQRKGGPYFDFDALLKEDEQSKK